MRILHFSDLHANKERKPYCLSVLSQIKTFVKNNEVDYVLFSGDFWDSTITNTEISGFTTFIEAVKEIATITNLVIISGTPFHEPQGSIDVFKSVGATVITKAELLEYDDIDILAIPEPRRNDFSKTSTQDSTNEINEYLESCFKNNKKNNKPFVVLYHGEIEGAFYDNGQKITKERCKTAIAPATMRLCKADYYACGHIHLPHEVFHNCYYVGSSYPLNYGEYHDGGFNEVVISKNKTEVIKHSFNLPVYKTYEIKENELKSFLKNDLSNINARVYIFLDKQKTKASNTVSLQNEIKAKTNANNIKVSFVYEENALVRTKEISEKRTALDKFLCYADYAGITVTEGLKEKLVKIQNEFEQEFFLPRESFELQKLRLRGAIGIKDGLGEDEIEIDFTKYQNGIVALTGKNGTGKTTIIENCHPFPKMLTRDGDLREHFFLKDSFRKLVYKTQDGSLINISILIDATNKSVPIRCFVEKFSNNTWQAEESCDGSLTSYKEYVENTFGSVNIFLRTSFYAKEQIKDLPDLAVATKATKMNLFSTLAGTDWLKCVSEKAKELGKSIQKELEETTDLLKNLESDMLNFSLYKKEYEKETEALKRLELFQSEDNDKLSKLRKEHDFYITETARNSNIISEIESRKENKLVLEKEKETLDKEFEKLAIVDIEEIEAGIKEQERYEKSISEIEKKLSATRRELKDLEYKYQTKTNSFIKTQELLSQKKQVLLEEQNKQSLTLSKIVDVFDVCPVCETVLSEDKKNKILNDNEVFLQESDVYKSNIKNYQSVIEECEKTCLYTQKIIGELGLERKRLETKESQLVTELNSVKDLFDKAKEIALRQSLFQTKEKLNALSAEQEKLLLKIKRESDKIAELEVSISLIPDSKETEISLIEQRIKDTQELLIKQSAKVENLCLRLKELSNVEEETTALKQQKSILENHVTDYLVIQKAFSNEGIQLLELDASAPEIALVANEILTESLGDRFKIYFETQRCGSKGQLIDDFVISVFDSKSGKKKKFSVLSSGESVWIKQALFLAFSVVRAKHTGFCFRTRFLDESDGSLDTESRTNFLKMIEVAHKTCNATLSILITHSKEIKDVCEQQIELIENQGILT